MAVVVMTMFAGEVVLIGKYIRITLVMVYKSRVKMSLVVAVIFLRKKV